MTPQAVLATLLLTMLNMNAVEMRHRLDRLTSVGRVLYVAAHPDDENTQLLAYLTHAVHARTTYLSLTRGDGGQNLIGSEQSPLMGVIRTHELMAARRIDGAEQMFTRARDFGYSKRSDEALAVWGREVTLGDVVWAMRRFRPHVVITRFPEEGSTHGHHLASAILAREAFAAAADPTRFPEQLERVEVWQAHRLLYNVPNRFMPEEARPDDLVVDIGGYDPVSGLSHGEIAAASRTMHKSQGFGAARRFGPEPERFRHLAGEPAERELLDGVDTDWASVPGGAAVGSALDTARRGFRDDAPAAIIPDLVTALRALDEVADPGVQAWAKREIAQLVVGASGLLLEARAEVAAVVPGDEVEVTVQALLRNDAEITWTSLALGEETQAVSTPLVRHQLAEQRMKLRIGASTPHTTFPWLEGVPGPGRYVGEGDSDRPLPDPPLRARIRLVVAGAPLDVEVPVQRVVVDPIAGEKRRDLEVLPAITATPAAHAVVLPCPVGGVAGVARCETRLRVDLRVRHPGRFVVEAPEGYRVSPETVDVDRDRVIELAIAADVGAKPGTLRLFGENERGRWSFAERALRHDHLPERTVLLPAEVKVDCVVLDVPDLRVGHIAGPGDEVADGLRRAGVTVEDLSDDDIANGDLDRFGAILVGVRAFNTRDALRASHHRLFDFAERGGTVVVQYATKPRTEELDVPLLPAAMTLGRGRVTDETAAVSLLAPDHPLLTTPHRIEAADFEGWVQERGLYFGASWDEERVVPLLSMADQGEEPERGSLLAVDHGKGRVIYVGLSLFRQFPAAVPGAYRLMMNLLQRRTAIGAALETEPPPVLGSWRKLYLVVLIILAVVIGSFYLLTRRYRS